MVDTHSEIPSIEDAPRSKYGVILMVGGAFLVLSFLVFSNRPNTETVSSELNEIPVEPSGAAEIVDTATPRSGEAVVPFSLPSILEETPDESLESRILAIIPAFDDPMPVPTEKEEKAYFDRLRAPKTVALGSDSNFNRQNVGAGNGLDDLDGLVVDLLEDLGGSESLRGAPTEETSRSSYFVDNIQRPQLEATFLEQLDFTLLESTMIPIVIDQAINTELPGRLRATVARNIWSADGRRILVPRGTRAMGEYTTAMLEGQSRVFAIWTRLLDPYGLDVPIASGTSDSLGMAGLDGQVNRHFFRRFGAAALISIIGGYAQSESQNDNQRNAIANDFNGASMTTLNSTINIAPTITRDAASIASIYVNQDINFYKAYEVGLSKKREREKGRAIYASLEEKRALSELVATEPKQDITQLDEISKFADPNPLSLGRLPLAVGAARRASENQIANGFKTAFSISKALTTIQIDETTKPNSCGSIFTVTAGRLLSVLTQDFLLECGFMLDAWLPAQNGIVMDWKFEENADISMPHSIKSLAALLSEFSIKLVLDQAEDNRYTVKSFQSTNFQLQKN
jgi:type IV secretory pathway VirB10-like protein